MKPISVWEGSHDVFLNHCHAQGGTRAQGWSIGSCVCPPWPSIVGMSNSPGSLLHNTRLFMFLTKMLKTGGGAGAEFTSSYCINQPERMHMMAAPSTPYSTLISCQTHTVWITNAPSGETALVWDAGGAQCSP